MARKSTTSSPSTRANGTPKSSTQGDPRTDRERWRLLDERGRQRWRYMHTAAEAEAWPQSTVDRFHLGLPLDLPSLPRATTPMQAVDNGLTFFSQLQLPPGNWASEYGGPMFLLPGLTITWYITGARVPDEYKIEIRSYLFARQSAKDGGWGLHIEGESSVFGTAMNYATLRLLGADAEDPRMIRARGCLHELGGAAMGPHWAKFWLSVLGVCEWEAVNPVPPELWLLPDWMPIAPWRWWIHMRQVFLPMSYIYSKRYSHPLDDLTRSLREELYTAPYARVDFRAHRNTISPRDNYHPKSALLNTINWALVHVWNPYLRTDSLTRRAEAWAYELIEMEDANTDFACLAPVNAPLNTICRFLADGPASHAVRMHHDRLDNYLWMNPEGMLANGTDGVQTWDTSFLIQAVVDAGVATSPKWRPMLLSALAFLDDQQIREEVAHQSRCYRHSRAGAWAFSTAAQGYTVSDCTAEALKAVILLQSLPNFPAPIASARLRAAVDVLLTLQNPSGGFASYEPTRGNPALLERLNAAEVFGRIMVEYDYPECSTAVLTALHLFHTQVDATYRAAEINTAIARAADYVRAAQRKDGSWYGSWGVCFSYAGMFALHALATQGESCATSERVRRAAAFFLDRQNDDGGWGESYRACESGVWTPHPDGSQVVMTAWVVIALLEAQCEDWSAIEAGVRLIVRRQGGMGQWEQEGIEGVFNKTCMISFPNYKFYFPIKAVGMFAQRRGDVELFK